VRHDSTVADTHNGRCKIVVPANGQLGDAVQTPVPPFELTSRQHDGQACRVHSGGGGRVRRDEAVLANGYFQ